MIRAAILSVLLVLPAMPALAGPPPATAPFGAPVRDDCSGPGEQACMLDAIWAAASRLPEAKRARLKPDFAAAAAYLPDAASKSAWQARLGNAQPRIAGTDYAAQTAQQAVRDYGWQGFVARARDGAQPLNIGRPEIMAAALDLAPDAAARADLTELMFLLAGSPTASPRGIGGFNPDMFERADFGHVLAERMMKDCNAEGFARARRLTAAPDAIRYQLWAARINGGAGNLAARVRLGDGSSDTSFVRQALEGYGPVLKLGYCKR
ncbi:hypothetical protein K1X12_01370 [Hyphomonas sp. WL0036]|uniref:hypothetical protein n=1 Tax=Hyphomonas sediminis TaxID=2866160 RepID=UPI001C7FC5B3|nr:hypothetical protein [Hyphomonas sediminis]MBY9065527.1 hypothetical protein [Hyphomonas sediminis]